MDRIRVQEERIREMEENKRIELQQKILYEAVHEEERKKVHRERLKAIESERKVAVLSKIEKKNLMVEEVQKQK
jgi:hypothetical protein